MNSSGISFKNEIKALSVALAAVILVEIFFHFFVWQDKKFFIQLDNQYSKTSQTLGTAKARPSVLILGNSLAYNGVLPDEFSKYVRSTQKRDMKVDRAILFGCRIAEWNYILKNYFTRKGRRPDVLLVAFTSDFLLDTAPVSYNYLPDFCTWRNIPEIIRNDLGEFEDRVATLLCFVSKTYRYRQSFRHYFLNGFVPYYKDNKNDLIQVAHAPGNSYTDLSAKGNVYASQKYERLQRFLKTVKQTKSDMIMVAMPVQAPYKVDPVVIKMVTDAGYHWVDGANLIKIPTSDFSDKIHLNRVGGSKFTRALADYLLKNYPREFRNRKTNKTTLSAQKEPARPNVVQ